MLAAASVPPEPRAKCVTGGEQWLLHRPTPRVDVAVKDDAVEMTPEFPGVKREELDVSVSDHTLPIRGTTSYAEEKKEAAYDQRERHKGEFSRTVVLPADGAGEVPGKLHSPTHPWVPGRERQALEPGPRGMISP